MFGEALRVRALGGERVSWVLEHRTLKVKGRDGVPAPALAPASRNAYRRVLTSFLGWLRDTRALPPTRLGGEDFDEGDGPELTTYTDAQIDAITRAYLAEDSVTNRRGLAWFKLVLESGLRAAEACGVTVDDLDRRTAAAHVIRKRGKRDVVDVSDVAMKAIDAYLAVRRSGLDELFVTDGGKAPLTPDAMRQHFAKVLDRAGIAHGRVISGSDGRPARQQRLSLHTLRRNFAKDAAALGCTDDELAELMGWSTDYAHDVKRFYTKPTRERLAELRAAAARLRRRRG
jgi:integrase